MISSNSEAFASELLENHEDMFFSLCVHTASCYDNAPTVIHDLLPTTRELLA